MGNELYLVFGGCVAVVALFGSVGVLVFGAFRVQREAMEILADLASEHRAGMENMFKAHANSLENLRAIETCGVEGMRGVVARSQVRPSVLDLDEDEEPTPSPDEKARGPNSRFIDVGHMASVGPEDYHLSGPPIKEP